MPKPLKCILFIILWFLLIELLASCASKPPDIAVFENLQQHLGTDPVTQHLILKPSPACMLMKVPEPECGHGVYVMSGKEFFVGEDKQNLWKGKKWSAIKAESIYMPAVESYAPMTTYIINECKQNNCDNQVDAFKIKLNSLNGINGAIQNPP